MVKNSRQPVYDQAQEFRFVKVQIPILPLENCVDVEN